MASEANAKVSSPEIAALERQLARRRREAELNAMALPGQLHMHQERDESGRLISTFYGDPEACWGQFKAPVRAVSGWNTK